MAHGITSATASNILFGAGVWYKNLAYTAPTYSLTQDTSIVAGKTYYTRSGTSPNYTYTRVTNPSASSLSSYYEATGGGWGGTILGATSGGGKITIKGEIKDIELDGALVKVKGLAVKTGGTATADVNFAEINANIMKAMMLGQTVTSGSDVVAGFDLITDKAHISAGDYISDFGFVGETADGSKKIIVIFDNAICTSGLPIETKNKENSVFAGTFEAYADDDADLDVLPIRIYYPSAV